MRKLSVLILKSVLTLAFTSMLTIGIVAVPLHANATIINFTSILEEAQVLPTPAPHASIASGSAIMVLDTLTNQFSWNIHFQDLSGPAIAAHFHGPAFSGTNAGVQVNIGAINGLTAPLIGLTTLTNLQETVLMDGLWYINIHTALNPAGEIRGQVNVAPVPEPSTILLFGCGLVGLIWYGRKRKKA